MSKRPKSSGSPRPPIDRRYNLKAIVRARNSLAEILRVEYGGAVVPPREFARLVEIVAEALGADLDRETLADSLRHLAGVVLTADLIESSCHRLAGNLARLRERRPVVPWHVQKFPEWVPLQVLAAHRARNARGELGALFAFKIMAGTPCPRIVARWWSFRFCRFAARGLGFDRGSSRIAAAPPRYPYTAPEQLVTLRFDGLVDPDRSDREPFIGEVRFPDRFGPWNRVQLRRRFRVDPGYDCPEGHPREFPCHRCPTGYLRCPAGTHRLDYIFKACPTCGRCDAPYDPEVETNVCKTCHDLATRNRRNQDG